MSRPTLRDPNPWSDEEEETLYTCTIHGVGCPSGDGECEYEAAMTEEDEA